LKSYKLPGTDQILAELFQAVCEILNSEVNELINYIWNKEEFSQQCKESIFLFGATAHIWALAYLHETFRFTSVY
jgi:hypothetical protein